MVSARSLLLGPLVFILSGQKIAQEVRGLECHLWTGTFSVPVSLWTESALPIV